ncbi:hypothetical protein [Mycoplasma anserisalpingitidis]|uniref:Variable surface lipoprotein n=1 Tax=Mycoplasma anserisalpingitidis TaxID=519450 RepID=A0A5B8K054_9MOLU|nr:hypothetical protein [Mycoplasma anserisalpingitidis]QDY88151.1 hypothetical protein FOY43_00520 [Mycoplasma anserisalpingitidis]
MKFKLKNLLIGGVLTSMMPLVALSASCGKKESGDQGKDTSKNEVVSVLKLDLTKLENGATIDFKSLNSETKYKLEIVDKSALIAFLSDSSNYRLYFDSYKNKENLPEGFTSYQSVITSESDFNLRKTVMKIYSDMKNLKDSYFSGPIAQESLTDSNNRYYRQPDKRVKYTLSEDKTTVTMKVYETKGVTGETLDIDKNAEWTLEIKIK